MNYIEEMMKIAEVKKFKDYRQYNFSQVPYGKEELKKSQDKGVECIRIRHCQGNNDCIYWTELHYPRFTPEKQLEIIKEIGLHVGFKIIANEGFDWILSEDTYVSHQYNKQGYSMTDFSQALAQLAIELMNEGRLDKQKVKKFLEK